MVPIGVLEPSQQIFLVGVEASMARFLPRVVVWIAKFDIVIVSRLTRSALIEDMVDHSRELVICPSNFRRTRRSRLDCSTS